MQLDQKCANYKPQRRLFFRNSVFFRDQHRWKIAVKRCVFEDSLPSNYDRKLKRIIRAWLIPYERINQTRPRELHLSKAWGHHYRESLQPGRWLLKAALKPPLSILNAIITGSRVWERGAEKEVAGCRPRATVCSLLSATMQRMS